MVTEPITYIGVHLGPNVGADDTIVGVRVVPSGRAAGRFTVER